MKKYIKWFSVILITIIITTIVIIESIYFLYIDDFKPYFITSKNRYSRKVEEVILAENRINQKGKIEATFIEKEILLFLINSNSNNFKLLYKVVKTFKYPQKIKRKNWIILQIISPIWLSRHWDFKQVISTLIDRYYGNGIYTFKEASLYYFNKKDNYLTLDEIVTLIAISSNPRKLSNIIKRAFHLQKMLNKYRLEYKNYIYKTPVISNCILE